MNQVDSPLLRLHAELRNCIFSFALDLGSKDVFHRDHYDWDRLDLPRTCHQIFTDTAAKYFNNHILPLKEDLRFLTSAALRNTISVLMPVYNKVVVKFRWKRKAQWITETNSDCPLDALRNLREVILVVDKLSEDSDDTNQRFWEDEDTGVLRKWSRRPNLQVTYEY